DARCPLPLRRGLHARCRLVQPLRPLHARSVRTPRLHQHHLLGRSGASRRGSAPHERQAVRLPRAVPPLRPAAADRPRLSQELSTWRAKRRPSSPGSTRCSAPREGRPGVGLQGAPVPPSNEEVMAWIERLRSAWASKDLAALRALGEVSGADERAFKKIPAAWSWCAEPGLAPERVSRLQAPDGHPTRLGARARAAGARRSPARCRAYLARAVRRRA